MDTGPFLPWRVLGLGDCPGVSHHVGGPRVELSSCSLSSLISLHTSFIGLSQAYGPSGESSSQPSIPGCRMSQCELKSLRVDWVCPLPLLMAASWE